MIVFWAPWCSLCRLQAPILEQLANELGNKIKILKMNVDENPDIPSELGIMIPTLLIKKDGQLKNRLIGVYDKESLLAVLQEYL